MKNIRSMCVYDSQYLSNAQCWFTGAVHSAGSLGRHNHASTETKPLLCVCVRIACALGDELKYTLSLENRPRQQSMKVPLILF